MKKIIKIIILLIIGFKGLEAQVPVPAAKQENPIILKNGIIHDGNGNVIENKSLLIENGKIVQIDSFDALNKQGADIIDLSGKHIYPGLIMPMSQLGLSEIGAVRASNDTRETGELNPNVRSIIAYNTDSELIPTIRSNGVMIAQIIPSGGLISGSSSVVQLDAWNWEEAVVEMDNAIHLNWPAKYIINPWAMDPTPKKNKQYKEKVEKIRQFFNEADAYNKTEDIEKENLKFEAVKGLFEGTQRLFINASAPEQIIECVSFAKEIGIKNIVLTNVNENVLLVKDFIKENNIPVILREVHNLPGNEDQDVWINCKLPAMLYREGIKVAIGVSWLPISINYAFKAASAATFGLSKEETLQIITKNPAEILGIDNRLGTIETGKDATIIISEGDILDITTNNVVSAFIQGRKIDLDNRHKYLYRKFKEKYE